MEEIPPHGSRAPVSDDVCCMTLTEWHAIEMAAMYAFEGSEAEAELTRFAAGYHNLAPMAAMI